MPGWQHCMVSVQVCVYNMESAKENFRRIFPPPHLHSNSLTLRFAASSSQFCFLVTKMRTDPEEVNSTRREVSQPHLTPPRVITLTTWEK